MNKFSIGTRVKFNESVAGAYVGKIGTVIEHRESVICGHVNVVKLDEPTRCAPHWPLNETLGAGDHCMDIERPIHGESVPDWQKHGFQKQSPVPCQFEIGDNVIYTNEYKVKFDCVVTGFAAAVTTWGAFIHLNTDAHWFPHKPESLQKSV